MRSIRTRLAASLGGALAVGIAVAAVATYASAHRAVSRTLDDELRQFAQAVHLREDWLEAGTVRIAPEDVAFAVRVYDEGGRLYFESGLPALPADAPQTLDPGYSEVEAPDGPWRMYTHVTPQGVVQVAQPHAAREALARSLALQMALPLLLAAPLLVTLAVGVVMRGLAPLAETSRRVRDRDAARLEPLPTAGVPQELLPLVAAINALLGRLDGALAAQRRFIADAAHELRSPIAALVLQAQLAERARTPERRAAAFAELKAGIDRAGRLIQQLLDLARLERDGAPPERAPVDLAGIAREVVAAAAARAGALGVDLGAEAPVAALVAGSAAELRSLLANLVDNALRYAPRGTAVTLAVRTAGGRVELEVSDAGPGIPLAERERVLERFQRVSGDETVGSGLGLAIAKAIADRHGGTLALEDSRPGGALPGLTVRVALTGIAMVNEPRTARTACDIVS